MLKGATVVGIGEGVALSKGDVAGSEVAYSVVSVGARLSFTRVEETSAGCCVTVFYVLSVVVVGTVVTRERRDVGATLACSAANCIVRVNYEGGTRGLYLLSRMPKYPPLTTREMSSAISS